MPQVLLVDDNIEILAANRDYLVKQGFGVTCANTGIKALAYLNENSYDCIVLDVLLPDLDGFSICKVTRTITDTPILFLSCLEEADDKVKGLISGGDDYMTKPYSLKELTARINAMLRRSMRSSPSTSYGRALPRGDFFIDRDNKIINVMNKNVLLSEREFNLFLLFHDNPSKVFSKEEILERIWYGNAEHGVVAVMVLKLRRKLDFAKNVIGGIENSYGAGYHLEPPVREGKQ
ncbi:MAG: response regulator transcription factor [Clostridiales bacterium]|nr:response regulator transcription factor [Clostridiales bacterium]